MLFPEIEEIKAVYMREKGNPRKGKVYVVREFVDRTCPVCNVTFRVEKSSVQRCCSRTCSNRVPRQGNTYSCCRGGMRTDLGHYVRSGWEANIARLLRHFGITYAYEPKTFVFGGLSYTPDFLVGGTYYEIKGQAASRNDWNCSCVFCTGRKEIFERAQLSIPLKLLGAKEYNLLERRYSRVVKGWG